MIDSETTLIQELHAALAVKDEQIAKLHLILMRQAERIAMLIEQHVGEEPEKPRRPL